MNRDGLPLGRLFGIEIRVSLLWAVLIAIVTLIGAEQASLLAPHMPGVIQWAVGAAVAGAFLVSVLAHEVVHALVARRRGVEVTTLVLGFVGGLAPLNVQARRPADELAIAASGPALSLGLAVGLVAGGALVGGVAADLAVVASSLIIVGVLNLILGVLSLVPGLPLDGGRIVRALAWARTGDADRATRVTARVGRLFGMITIGAGVVIAFFEHFTEGLLVLALGWLLVTGARTLERRLGLELLLRGVPVREAMETDVPQIGPNLTIDTFSTRYEGPDGVPSMPVVADEEVLGVLGVNRLRRLGRRRFASTRASEVMATPPQAPFLDPDEALWGAVDLLQRTGQEGLAVARDGRLAGMLTRRGIAAVVRARMAASDGSPG